MNPKTEGARNISGKTSLPECADDFISNREFLPEGARCHRGGEIRIRMTGMRHAEDYRLPDAPPLSYDPYWAGYQGALERMDDCRLALFQSRAEAAVAAAIRAGKQRERAESAHINERGDGEG